MDADTYPRADVQEALKAYICVHINAETAGESADTAKKYGVDSFPRLMILDPMGNKLVEIKGKPHDEGFGERLPYDLHNTMAIAARDGDLKTAATKMVILRKWFEGTEARKGADDWYRQLESNTEFKALYDAAWKTQEDALAKVKADVEVEAARMKEEAARRAEAAEKARIEAETKERKDLMAEAAEHSKKDRRKEAIACWQKVNDRWPDSEEAKTARGKLKFFGVKVETPKK